MELTVIGSSSNGNSYVLQNDQEALIIECGMPIRDIKKCVDFNISKISGAIVTHEHLDHSKYVNDFLVARIKTYMSLGTKEAIELRLKSSFMPNIIKHGIKYEIGKFTVLPFTVKHDCKEPLGFLIKHSEIGVLMFATDTYYLPYKFDGLTNVMLECNYRTDILERNIAVGRIPSALRDRTIQSHMSFDTCKEALLANDLSKVNNIVLIHLSDGNSNAEEFKRDIHRATGKTVHVADKGLKIKFNKIPF